MLPLTLLNTSQGHPMLVELKSGETLNGHLVNCDAWMNLTLKEVVQTNADGTRFFRLPECYVRGNNIKYLRVPDDVLDIAREKNQQQREEQRHNRGNQNQGSRQGYNRDRSYNSNHSNSSNGGYQRGGYNSRGGRGGGRGGGQYGGRGGRGGQGPTQARY
ncbi:uncharacterized protein V1518DRAFT_424048 [Limtongia smithiae]|uniref:uncharacterized protein n=1 Tax=Limtongia smithiae TaxID=1125753 RepID=UPI0034CE5496